MCQHVPTDPNSLYSDQDAANQARDCWPLGFDSIGAQLTNMTPELYMTSYH